MSQQFISHWTLGFSGNKIIHVPVYSRQTMRPGGLFMFKPEPADISAIAVEAILMLVPYNFKIDGFNNIGVVKNTVVIQTEALAEKVATLMNFKA